jgi:hypothetical protein
MLRLMLLTTAAAFALASSVADAEDKPPPKADDKPAAKVDDKPPPKADSKSPAKAASKPSPKTRTYRAAAQLPPGLPRAGYRYRTTITPATPVAPYRAPLPETDEALLITPAYGPGGYLDNLPGTPLLPGSTTIPGYYGRPFDYDYQGPYYGGPYVSYYWRLPYACGVYGYC